MKDEPSNEHGQTPNLDMWLEDHGEYLFRYALVQLREREIVEDMVQETFWPRYPHIYNNHANVTPTY